MGFVSTIGYWIYSPFHESDIWNQLGWLQDGRFNLQIIQDQFLKGRY